MKFWKRNHREHEFTPDQEAARAEWRKLCFVLEGLQATELNHRCQDKYAVAKTYSVYGRHHERALAEVREQLDREDFSFFVNRGVARGVMNRKLAEAMLRDWIGAVASKRNRVAENFEGRFNEDIDVFCALPGNAARIASAKSVDWTDALLLLDMQPPQKPSVPAEPRKQSPVFLVLLPASDEQKIKLSWRGGWQTHRRLNGGAGMN